MKTKNASQFLIASTVFAMLNILYLFLLTQAPTIESKNLAISYDEVSTQSAAELFPGSITN